MNTYRNSAKYPIRFDALHPGSTFRIVRELSRGIYHSNDQRVYRKDRIGFFAENIETKAGCCLLPEDLVMPVIAEGRARSTTNVVPFRKPAAKPAAVAAKVVNA